jgi:DNA modification methylase
MIEMWDDVFISMAPEVKNRLEKGEGDDAFELMHRELDKVWNCLARAAKDGSFVCINIGDATRTIGGEFQLYSNHSRIIRTFKRNGFTTLPIILWRKKTNAPNKFMGSGMLPAGAYVTLEHEYILIFRKGGKRVFHSEQEKKHRMESAFFREERNAWFSDIWDFKGVRQKLAAGDVRERSAAFPFELAWRLINMYSLRGGLVFDPFAGTGTTLHAAAACGRNSIGVEIDKNFGSLIFAGAEKLKKEWNSLIRRRAAAHREFMKEYEALHGKTKYTNAPHGFPVVTRQETEIALKEIDDISGDERGTTVRYKPFFEE